MSDLDSYIPTSYPIPALSIANEKGGVGKTTISLWALEAAVLRLGLRALVIDADIQGNLTRRTIGMEDIEVGSGVTFKVPPEHPDYDPDADGEVSRPSLAGVFMNEIILPYKTWLNSDDIPELNGAHADIIASHGEKLEKIQTMYSTSSGKIGPRIFNALHQIIQDEDMKESYDVVIFDTGPSRNALSRAVMRSVTHVIVPIEFDDASVDGVLAMQSSIRFENNHRAGIGAPDLKLIGLLPNKFVAATGNRTSTSETIYHQLKPHWDNIFFPRSCFIPQAEATKRLAAGEHARAGSVFDLGKKSKSEFRLRLAVEHATYEIFHQIFEHDSKISPRLKQWGDWLAEQDALIEVQSKSEHAL